MSRPQPLSIAVAGCGPAGMAAAVLLRRQGHDVRILERFDIARPIGSGLMLQPTGLAVLKRMGLAGSITARGQRIDRLFGRAFGSDRVVLDVRYQALAGGGHGLAVHRSALFDVLAEAVAAEGIRVEGRAEIGRLKLGPAGAFLEGTGDHGRHGPFDLVVDALGSRSPLIGAAGLVGKRHDLPYGALWATLRWPDGSFDPHALEQRYHQASRMVGVLPLGVPRAGSPPQAAFFWSMKPEDYKTWRSASGSLGRWKAEVSRLWPETEPLIDQIGHKEEMTFARYWHFTARGATAERYVAIGDAAHSASPQLGQGANMALLDAYALAQALGEARSLPAALSLYEQRRRFHVRLYQAMSAMFTPFYQSDSLVLPFFRDRVAAPLSRLPAGQRLLAAMVAGTLGAGLKSLLD